jgi:hypothetical protein
MEEDEKVYEAYKEAEDEVEKEEELMDEWTNYVFE